MANSTGMYSGTNMCHVIDQGDGYIVSKSLKKTKEEERKWALNRDDFVVVSDDFRYKSHIVTRTVTAEDGSKRKIREKVLVYWSRSFYERERHENKSFLEFIEKLKANPIAEKEDSTRYYGISGKRVSNALRNWQVDMLPGDIYRMSGVTNEDLKQILKAFNLTIPTKMFTRGELRSLKSSVEVFWTVGV